MGGDQTDKYIYYGEDQTDTYIYHKIEQHDSTKTKGGDQTDKYIYTIIPKNKINNMLFI
jgi:hypothetical protein